MNVVTPYYVIRIFILILIVPFSLLHGQIRDFTPPENDYWKESTIVLDQLVPGEEYLLKFEHDLSNLDSYDFFDPTEIQYAFSNYGQLIFSPNKESIVFHHPGFNPYAYKPRRQRILLRKLEKPKDSRSNVATLTVEENSDINYLVEEKLLGNFCINPTNVTSQGPGVAIGTFGSGGFMGIENGIILMSGSINDAPGPNNVDNAGIDLFNPGDPDLNTIAGQPTFDATVIEFDFIADDDFVSFDYIFASEEYCEWVDQYNDVFGFFLSGPGINGAYSNNAINIATLPDGTPVGINTVHYNLNSMFYVDNFAGFLELPTPPDCPANVSNNPPATLEEIQFDGYTTVLNAYADVIPCEQYHIKIAVGDALDGIYDSAVFLKENSFTSGQIKPTIEYEVFYEDGDIATEGCENAYVVIHKIGSINFNLIADIIIDGSSSATEGVDYADIPDFINIGPGITTDTIWFDIFGDLLEEGIENIILSIDGICECEEFIVEVQIEDAPPLLTSIVPEYTYCGSAEVTIPVNVQGGTPGYMYEWSNGSTDPSITVVVDGDETYTVTVTDACGKEEILETSIYQYPEFFFSDLVNICANDSFEVNGTYVYESGVYYQNYFTQYGCDSIYQVILNVIEPLEEQTTVYACEGECITYEGTEYCNPGVYEQLIEGVAEFGCDSLVSLQVEWLSPESSIQEPANILSCENDSIQIFGDYDAATGQVDFIWSGPNNWSSTIQNPWVFESGTYYFTIQQTVNGLTCESAIDSVEVLDNFDYPQIDPGDNVVLTCGITEMEVEAQIGNDNGNIVYWWEFPDGSLDSNLITTVMDSGIYTFYAFNEISQCMSDSSIAVSIFDEYPEIDVDSAFIGCDAANIIINSNVNVPGGTYEWIGPNNFTSSEEDPVVNELGFYYVTYIINDNCVTTDSIEVLQDNTVPEVTVTTENISCANTEATITFSSPSYSTSLWTGPGGYSSEEQTTEITTEGTYTLEVTGDNGCIYTTTVDIIDESYDPDISVNEPSITCSDDMVQLEVNGMGIDSFYWQGPNGFESNDEFPMINEGGDYSVFVLDSNECFTTIDFNILTDTIAPQITLLPDTLNCYQNTITIQNDISSDVTEVYWTDPNGDNSTDFDMIADEEGLYSVIVTSENGCTDEDEVFIESNFTIPDFTVSGDTIDCGSGLAEMNAIVNTADYVITWFDENQNVISMNDNAEVSQAGDYYAEVIDIESGCKDTLGATISLSNDAPDLTTFTDTVNCLSSIFEIGAISSNGNSFDWDGPDNFSGNTSTVQITLPGTYMVTVYGDNDCSTTEIVEVAQDNQEPDLTGFGDTINCYNPIISIDVGASGQGFDFDWEGPDNFSSTDEILQNIGTSGTYSVTVTGSNGCSNTRDFVVSEDFTIPTIDLQKDNDLDCINSSAVITSNIITPNLDIIEWQGPDGFTDDQSIISVSNGGIYIVYVLDQNGCSNSDTIEVFQDTDMISVSAQDGHLDCNQSQLELDVMYGQGTVDSYQWTGPNGFTSDQPNPVVDKAGEYIVTVTADNGCVTTQMITISSDFEIPSTSLLGGTLDCNNQIVNISTQYNDISDLDIEWQHDGTFFSNNANLNVDQPGMYVITVEQLSNGCIFTDSIFINLIDYVQDYELEYGDPACEVNSGYIEFVNIEGGSQPYFYSINGGQNFQTDPIFIELPEGEYQTMVMDSFGCIVENPVSLVNLPSYLIEPLESVRIELGSSQQIIVETSIPANLIDTIIWEPAAGLSCTNCLDPIATPDETTIYTVTIIDSNGCAVSETIEIRVFIGPLYIPNVFSPNDDGDNDFWRIFAKEQSIQKISKLYIFDRWGNKVYTLENTTYDEIGEGWDGRFNEEDAQQGVYTYLLLYVDGLNEEQSRSGTITLVR